MHRIFIVKPVQPPKQIGLKTTFHHRLIPERSLCAIKPGWYGWKLWM